MTPARFWAGFFGVGLAVEMWGLSHPDRNPWTASPNIRAALRADTPAGRALITIGIGAGSSWLAHHLLTVEPEESQ
jgi:hypothetical protein